MNKMAQLVDDGIIDADFILDCKDVRSVYLFRSGKLYKVGYARHVLRRLASVRCGSAQPVELVLTIETEDFIALESAFHALFRSKRRRGEWFELDAGDIAIMRSFPTVATLMAQADINDPRIVQAQQLRRAGTSYKQLAQHFNVSMSTVSRWIRTTLP